MKGFKKQRDDSSMNIYSGILGCIFLGELRVCKGLRRDESCHTRLCSNIYRFFWHVQWMEEVDDEGPWYFRSWENIPWDCSCERLGVDRSAQRRFPDDHWAASASQPGLAAGWVGAFWPTLDEEPYQFPKKPHKSQVHHNTNHIYPTHQAIAIHCWISSIPSITSNHSCIDGIWWDDTAHHCFSLNLLGMHIACLPPAPSAVHVASLQRYDRRGILEITMAMIMLVSWIRWQQVAGFDLIPWPADIHFSTSTRYIWYVVQVWRSLYVFTVFLAKISVDKSWIWIILTCCEALACPIFSKRIRWDWLKRDCYGI